LDGIEGSVENSNSCGSVNISAIAHALRKLGYAQLMMLGDTLHKKNPTKIHFFLVESRQTTFYTHVLKVNINFNAEKTRKNYQTQ